MEKNEIIALLDPIYSRIIELAAQLGWDVEWVKKGLKVSVRPHDLFRNSMTFEPDRLVWLALSAQATETELKISIEKQNGYDVILPRVDTPDKTFGSYIKELNAQIEVLRDQFAQHSILTAFYSDPLKNNDIVDSVKPIMSLTTVYENGQTTILSMQTEPFLYLHAKGFTAPRMGTVAGTGTPYVGTYRDDAMEIIKSVMAFAELDMKEIFD